MGMTSALKLQQTARLAEMVIAIEVLAATRALDLRRDTTTPILESAKARFRERVPAWTEDEVLSGPMECAASFLAKDGFRHIRDLALVEAC
jgi:histidine ammonia-lyase